MTIEQIKHQIGEIALMCDEKDEKQMDILVALLALINDINIESEKPITETSMHHLICAMCDNEKCVRGTKECEFEKWKKKESEEEE